MKIILDTETTGLLIPEVKDPKLQPSPIEIGIIIVDDDWQEMDKKSWLINPGFPVPEEVIPISGINDEMLADAPPFVAIYPELCQHFWGVDTLIAHNLPFDHGILKFALKRIGKEYAFPWPWNQICTVERTTHFTGKYLSQEKLWKYLFDEEMKQQHRALPDCEKLLRTCQELHHRGIL